MRSTLVVLAAAAALAVLPMNGVAADYELEGFTSATFDGDQTVQGFTEACQAEFDSTTRMCRSVEVIETVNWPSLPTDTAAWTQPVFAPNPTNNWDRDASGLAGSYSGYLSCYAWTQNGGADRGLVTKTMAGFPGAFINSAWCSETLPVACCGPVSGSMATVPAIMWFGRGLLGAMVLSIAVAGLMHRRQLALLSGGSQIAPRR